MKSNLFSFLKFFNFILQQFIIMKQVVIPSCVFAKSEIYESGSLPFSQTLFMFI